MNLQFFHSRNWFHEKYNGATVACLLPSKESLMSLLNSSNKKVMISIGVSRCSVKDNYCKKTGRELAKERLNLHEFELTYVKFLGDKTYLTLQNSDLNAKVNSLELRLYNNSDTIHFIESNVSF